MKKPDWNTPKGLSPEMFSSACQASMRLRRLYEAESIDQNTARLQKLRAFISNVEREKVSLSREELIRYITTSKVAARHLNNNLPPKRKK